MRTNFSKTHWPVALVAVMSCFTSSGCAGLHWDTQVVVSRFAPDGSEVQSLFVYEGLHVSGAKPDEQIFTRAKQELSSLMTSDQRFYLADPLFEVSLAPPGPDEKRSEASQKALALRQKHLTIATGKFYLNKDKRLCAWQTVTIRDPQKFAAGLNELISLGMEEIAKETPARPRQKDELSDEMRRILQKAAHDNYAWLKLDPGRLSVSLPGNAHEFADLKRIALHAMLVKELEQLADPPEGTVGEPLTRDEIRKRAKDLDSVIRFISEIPISIDQTRDRMTLAVGEGQGLPLRLNFAHDSPEPGRMRKFEPELTEHARSLKVGFAENQTTEALIAGFLKKNDPAR
jgi:hypothetical protein